MQNNTPEEDSNISIAPWAHSFTCASDPSGCGTWRSVRVSNADKYNTYKEIEEEGGRTPQAGVKTRR